MHSSKQTEAESRRQEEESRENINRKQNEGGQQEAEGREGIHQYGGGVDACSGWMLVNRARQVSAGRRAGIRAGGYHKEASGHRATKTREQACLALRVAPLVIITKGPARAVQPPQKRQDG